MCAHVFHHIDPIHQSVHKSRPPQLKHNTSCNTILIPHMFFCGTQPIYFNQLLSPPPKEEKRKKKNTGWAVISFNLVYPVFSWVCQTLCECQHAGAELSRWETIVESRKPDGFWRGSALEKVHSPVRKHCTLLQAPELTHAGTDIQIPTGYTRVHNKRMRVETHSHTHIAVIHTRITLHWRGTGFTVSDCALSTGLELTDAQADYSAFSGHMTRKPACQVHSSGAGRQAWCSSMLDL